MRHVLRSRTLPRRDLFLVVVYFGLNVCWIYETFMRTFKGVDGKCDRSSKFSFVMHFFLGLVCYTIELISQ
jgi:hypothetical protein